MADLIVTDPPWNVAYGSSVVPGQWSKYKDRSILNDDLGEDFFRFTDTFCREMFRFVRPGAAVYVFMSAQEWPVIHKSLVVAGGHWSSTLIWVKDDFVISRKDYHTQYEPIWYGWKDGAPHEPVKDRTQSDIWHFPRPKVSEEHPTMKPVELLARAIKNSSSEGEIVLDPFGGSGSTLIACEQTGRRCFMIELSPKYADVIIARWEALTGLKAEKAAK